MSTSLHMPRLATRGWIAVVDDDASIRRSLARVCRGYDIPVLTFESAEAFLERRPASAPRCLVLDVNLGPGLNGFQLQQRLESEGSAPPIIFVTGRPETNAAMGARTQGAYGFLRKPIEIDTLLDLLRGRLDAAIAASDTAD